DVAQRQGITRLDVRARAALHGVALLEQARRENVALLAVRVMQQRDPSGAVRVVLDMRDLGRNIVLVVPAEIDQPVGTLMAAPLGSGRDLTGVVAATAAVQRADKRLLGLVAGDLDEVGHARAAPPWS